MVTYASRFENVAQNPTYRDVRWTSCFVHAQLVNDHTTELRKIVYMLIWQNHCCKLVDF